MSEHLTIIDRSGRRPKDGHRPLPRRSRLRRVALQGYSCTALLICLFGSSVVTAEESAAPAPLPGVTNGEMTPSVLLDDLESGSREKQARMARLRLQLQRIAEQNRRAREQTPAPAPSNEIPPAPGPEADLEPLMPELAPSDPHAVPEPPVEVPAHPADPAGHAQEHATVPPRTTETLVGVSINRLALGDSLFGTGQTELALQAYDSVEVTKVSAGDRYWIEYQIANCHRRLGNIPEAQKRYRKLAGLVDAGWCAGHARWWLDALDTRAELQKSLATVKTSLKSMEEQLNAKPAK
jgi:hypothetical protein